MKSINQRSCTLLTSIYQKVIKQILVSALIKLRKHSSSKVKTIHIVVVASSLGQNSWSNSYQKERPVACCLLHSKRRTREFRCWVFILKLLFRDFSDASSKYLLVDLGQMRIISCSSMSCWIWWTSTLLFIFCKMIPYTRFKFMRSLTFKTIH